MLCFLYILGEDAILFPISLLILDAPVLLWLIKHKPNILTICSLLTFIILGVLTNGLYGIPIVSLKADPIYEDMPHIINILLEYSPDIKIYPGSYYNYYIRRTLSFAQLRASNSLDSSGLSLVDKQYGIKEDLKGNTTRILYSGKRLMLVELKG